MVAVTEESIDNTEKKRLDQLSGAARRRIAMQSTTEEEEEEEEVEEFIQNRTHAEARFLTGEGEGAGGGGKFI